MKTGHKIIGVICFYMVIHFILYSLTLESSWFLGFRLVNLLALAFILFYAYKLYSRENP